MSKEKEEIPKCTVHKTPMVIINGAGWDYDKWVCIVHGCCEEIELEISTLPEKKNEEIDKE